MDIGWYWAYIQGGRVTHNCVRCLISRRDPAKLIVIMQHRRYRIYLSLLCWHTTNNFVIIDYALGHDPHRRI